MTGQTPSVRVVEFTNFGVSYRNTFESKTEYGGECESRSYLSRSIVTLARSRGECVGHAGEVSVGHVGEVSLRQAADRNSFALYHLAATGRVKTAAGCGYVRRAGRVT